MRFLEQGALTCSTLIQPPFGGRGGISASFELHCNDGWGSLMDVCHPSGIMPSPKSLQVLSNLCCFTWGRLCWKHLVCVHCLHPSYASRRLPNTPHWVLDATVQSEGSSHSSVSYLWRNNWGPDLSVWTWPQVWPFQICFVHWTLSLLYRILSLTAVLDWKNFLIYWELRLPDLNTVHLCLGHATAYAGMLIDKYGRIYTVWSLA